MEPCRSQSAICSDSSWNWASVAFLSIEDVRPSSPGALVDSFLTTLRRARAETGPTNRDCRMACSWREARAGTRLGSSFTVGCQRLIHAARLACGLTSKGRSR